jgi:beta-lactam-binding protein with PASTA domain
VNTSTGALSALRRITIVIAIAIVFVFGLASTVFLSLRSSEVKVPDVVGKDRLEAERVLGDAGLNFRVRTKRPSNQVQADMVLFQVPKAGDVVKVGQTVAMDISRPAKEGEASEAVVPEKSPEENPSSQNTNETANANENKPKKNKNTNKNANDNENANNRNRNANANANANANRAAANKNANNGNTNKATNLNSNRPTVNGNSNSNRGVNQNGPGRPAAAKPSPTVKPKPQNP